VTVSLVADRYEVDVSPGEAGEQPALDSFTGKSVVLRWDNPEVQWPSHPTLVRILGVVVNDGRTIVVEEASTPIQQVSASLAPDKLARLFDGLGWLHSRDRGLRGLAPSSVRLDSAGRLNLRPIPESPSAPGDVDCLVQILHGAPATRDALGPPAMMAGFTPAQVAAHLRGAEPGLPLPTPSPPAPTPTPRPSGSGASPAPPASSSLAPPPPPPPLAVSNAGDEPPPASSQPRVTPVAESYPPPTSSKEVSPAKSSNTPSDENDSRTSRRAPNWLAAGLVASVVIVLVGLLLFFLPMNQRSESPQLGDRGSDQTGTTAEQEYSLGYSLLSNRETDRAVVHLKRCTELDRDHADCWWELGWAYWRKENWSRVIACWTQVARVEPERPNLDRYMKDARLKDGSILAKPSRMYPTWVRRVRDGRPLSRSAAQSASCEELWGLRNWVFARHGFDFQTESARQYFDRQGGYRPVAGRGGAEVAARLTGVDEANRDLVLEFEEARGCK
jgi:hypothetical protein